MIDKTYIESKPTYMDIIMIHVYMLSKLYMLQLCAWNDSKLLTNESNVVLGYKYLFMLFRVVQKSGSSPSPRN